MADPITLHTDDGVFEITPDEARKLAVDLICRAYEIDGRFPDALDIVARRAPAARRLAMRRARNGE